MGNLDRLWDPWHMNKPKRKRCKTAKHDLEAGVLKECMVWLKQQGYYAERRNTGAFQTTSSFLRFGRPGAADIFAVIHGRHYEVEVKRRDGKGRLSGGQKAFQQLMADYRIPYIVVCSVEELKAAVRTWQLHETREKS